MKENITENILYDYFAGRSTPLQKKMIKEWLSDNANEDIFYYYLAQWETKRPQYEADRERGLSNYKAFLNDGKEYPFYSKKPEKSKKLFFLNIRNFLIAASVLFVLTFGIYLSKDFFLYKTYTTKNQNQETIMLSDGSKVILNANSTIKVPNDLKESSLREVWLKGEAFFSVAHKSANTRFIVHTENLNIEVLGTKFNVQNRRGKTEVVLNEGKIRLTSNEGGKSQIKTVLMKPNQLVSFANSDTALRIQTVKSENYSAWHHNKLVFKDTKLSDVAHTLEDFYGVKIIISDDKINNRELTGTLPNDDLSVVLKSLAATHNIEIIQSKDQIIWR